MGFMRKAALPSTSAKSAKSERLGVRATPQQQVLLRRAAQTARKSVTEFILDSACRAAEETLLDQRLFIVDPEAGEQLLDLMDQPPAPNEGLSNLMSRKTPWGDR
jgi:uncharacterized protein (DUF1778 family)